MFLMIFPGVFLVFFIILNTPKRTVAPAPIADHTHGIVYHGSLSSVVSSPASTGGIATIIVIATE